MQHRTLFSKGDRVCMQGQAAVGEVVRVRGKYAVVAFQGLEVSMPLQRLEKVVTAVMPQPRQQTKPRVLNLESDAFLSFNPAIDLHGLSVHDALQALDRWIDQAVLLGYKRLKVIHGKGKGILRNAVRTHCRSHSQVRHVDALHPYAGGAGVTGLALV